MPIANCKSILRKVTQSLVFFSASIQSLLNSNFNDLPTIIIISIILLLVLSARTGKLCEYWYKGVFMPPQELQRHQDRGLDILSGAFIPSPF